MSIVLYNLRDASMALDHRRRCLSHLEKESSPEGSKDIGLLIKKVEPAERAYKAALQACIEAGAEPTEQDLPRTEAPKDTLVPHAVVSAEVSKSAAAQRKSQVRLLA